MKFLSALIEAGSSKFSDQLPPQAFTRDRRLNFCIRHQSFPLMICQLVRYSVLPCVFYWGDYLLRLY